MTSTLQNALYSIQGSIGLTDGGVMSADPIDLTITSANGATDASAIALMEAIQGIAWPSGVTASLMLLKTDLTQVSSQADMSATPPVFE